MKARVCRFYGWTPDVVNNLPLKEFNSYSLAIDVLSSEEQLTDLQTHFSTHLKKEKRKELVDRLRHKIRSGIDRTGGKLATVQDLAKAFARMKMNG